MRSRLLGLQYHTATGIPSRNMEPRNGHERTMSMLPPVCLHTVDVSWVGVLPFDRSEPKRGEPFKGQCHDMSVPNCDSISAMHLCFDLQRASWLHDHACEVSPSRTPVDSYIQPYLLYIAVW